MRRATAREADELTGFTIGGIPPFGHVRATRVDHGPRPGAVPGRVGGRWRCRPRSSRFRRGRSGPWRTRWSRRSRNRRACRRRLRPRLVASRAGRPPRRRPTDASERGGVTAPPSGSGSAGPTAGRQPRDATIVYPGGLRARWRWAGSGEGPAVFALTEAGGPLTDHGALAGSTFEELCRAELRIDGPTGPWTVRLASLDLRRAGRAGVGRPRAARREVRLPDVRVRRPERRAALVAPLGVAAAGGLRVAAPRPRARPGRDRDLRARARRNRRLAGRPQRRRDRRRSSSAGGSC